MNPSPPPSPKESESGSTPFFLSGERHADLVPEPRGRGLRLRLPPGHGDPGHVDQAAEGGAGRLVGRGLHLPHPHQPEARGKRSWKKTERSEKTKAGKHSTCLLVVV